MAAFPVRRALKLLLGGAALACLIFQQSPGNEAVRTAAALAILRRTNNEFAVAATVGLLTMIIEGGSSLLIALGLHLDNDFVDRMLSRVRRVEPAGAQSTASRFADFGITLGSGAGLVVIKHHVLNPQRTRRQDARTGLSFALFGSAFSALIGFLAAGGIKYADRVGLGVPAKYFVKYATDWRSWMVLILFAYGTQGILKLSRRARPQPEATT